MIIDVNSKDNLDMFNQNKTKGPWFVWYYADWCGHCQNMKGEWERLEKDTNVNLAKVKDQFVTPEDNIVGFPTIKLLNSNKETVYNSSRDFGSFKKFLEDNVKPTKRKTPSPRPRPRPRPRRRVRRVTRKSIRRTRRPRRAMGPKKKTRRRTRRPGRPKKRTRRRTRRAMGPRKKTRRRTRRRY